MLEINGLVKKFGGVTATNDVSMSFAEGSLSAVIGPNGAGKTTLFNQITGHLLPDQGEILLNGENLVGLKPREIVAKGLGRAFQVASIFPTFSVLDALMSSVSAHEMKSEKLFQPFDNKVVRERAEQLLAVLGLESVGHVASSKISHGDQKVLDIGLALALKPRVLLLDEPTAGMGPDERWQMVRTVQRLWEDNNLTLIFIEHDMDIVFEIAQHIHVLRYGALIASGNADEIRTNEEVIEAYLGRELEEDA
ncbi:MAG TPA: ABC transporter ATP-binding protein [Alphaproteobacteria bacterium]|jgi:branched-chain amino acid transport system ATP-binding protein|nr:ABC transporter ATP-binding protein [Paracoccaceae bacterium]RCL80683.1 MAG: ABC transporter ATP-binding protein [SAR116 cluster bacterium]HCJ61888.1 ABC transporter ATP-binding protein [Alphaproteobacteria bacterium]HCY47443.1 ABC transporter ATP-binding protein [Alphaproteobacteria bacterium]|tara:strand:+ start:272 stop:1024 length:753 start_codon:yes stop_codon:yes gene_type:complete